MVVLYQNKSAITLYLVSLLTLVLSVFVFYMIFSDLDNFFTEYSSKLSGIGWLIFFLVMGNSLLACMIWMSGRYILQIKRIDDNNILIKTWSIIGFNKNRSYPVTIFNAAIYKKGVSKYLGAPIVIAPYSILKTPTKKRLILDELGTFNIETKVKNKTL